MKTTNDVHYKTHMFKFIDLCKSNNAQILHLALYCYKALELRNSIS